MAGNATAKKPPKTTSDKPPLWAAAGIAPPANKAMPVSPSAPFPVQRFPTPVIAPPVLQTVPFGTGIGGLGGNDATARSGGITMQDLASAGGPVQSGQDYTGWVRNVREGAIPSLFQNPESILAEVMTQQGLSPETNTGLYGMLSPFADYANALVLLGLGGSSAPGAMGNNAALNWIGDYFNQLMTRGGGGVSFDAGMNAIRNATDPLGSSLGAYLNLGDPAAQADAYKSLNSLGGVVDSPAGGAGARRPARHAEDPLHPEQRIWRESSRQLRRDVAERLVLGVGDGDAIR